MVDTLIPFIVPSILKSAGAKSFNRYNQNSQHWDFKYHKKIGLSKNIEIKVKGLVHMVSTYDRAKIIRYILHITVWIISIIIL